MNNMNDLRHYWIYNVVGGNIGARWAQDAENAITTYNEEKGAIVANHAVERSPWRGVSCPTKS